MSAIWLLFLGFPITEAATAAAPLAWRFVGVVGVLLYAAVYVRGFLKLRHTESWAQVNRVGVVHLAAMGSITAAMALLIGWEALGMVPFMVAMAMFTLPLPVALGVWVAALVLAAMPAFSADPTRSLVFVPIVLLVGVSTGVVRVLEQRGLEHQQHQRELTLIQERERVARDVHDVLGHSLTAVSVKAQLAERLVDSDPEAARAELQQIQSLSRQALAEIRATVAGLRVARLADELQTAAASLADAGIALEVAGGPEDVDPRHRIVLAWVVREAATNVVRHSGARRCRIELGAAGVVVVDDGAGLGTGGDGNGLRGLRERVASGGGTLRLGPGDEGHGTRLEVTL